MKSVTRIEFEVIGTELRALFWSGDTLLESMQFPPREIDGVLAMSTLRLSLTAARNARLKS